MLIFKDQIFTKSKNPCDFAGLFNGESIEKNSLSEWLIALKSPCNIQCLARVIRLLELELLILSLHLHMECT